MSSWGFLILLLIVAVGLFFVPHIALWAINTVFGTHLVVTVATWFAVWALLLLPTGVNFLISLLGAL